MFHVLPIHAKTCHNSQTNRYKRKSAGEENSNVYTVDTRNKSHKLKQLMKNKVRTANQRWFKLIQTNIKSFNYHIQLRNFDVKWYTMLYNCIQI